MKFLSLSILFISLLIPSTTLKLEVRSFASSSINPFDPAMSNYNVYANSEPDLYSLDKKWQVELQQWMNKEILSRNLHDLSLNDYDTRIAELEARIAQPYTYPSASPVSLLEAASGRLSSPFHHVTVPATRYCLSFQPNCDKSSYIAPYRAPIQPLNYETEYNKTFSQPARN